MYDGDEYPMPEGWDGLTVEQWFEKLETVRDRLMKADELNLDPMYDDDGDELDAAEVVLIKEYGFKNGGHWENFRNWGAAKWAAEMGETPTNLEFRMTGIAREKMMNSQIQAQSGKGGLLEPFEGITLEQWAQTNARIFGGGDRDQLIAALGIDVPKWDRVNAEWNDRMSKDTTFTIATAYGNAFTSATQGPMAAAANQAVAQGVGGDLGPEPVSYERYVEIMVAQDAASRQGKDATEALAELGLTVMDWSNIGMYWSKKWQQNAQYYHELDTKYRPIYEAKYGITNETVTADEDDDDLSL